MYFRRGIQFFAVLIAAALSLPLAAQTFDLAANGRQIVALDGTMRFHPGDDPQFTWASPTFDDSSWPLIRGDRDWTTQGYPQMHGFAWYRFKILLPDRTQPLALWVPSINTSFQIYAGGQLIGQFGGMPPHPRVLSGQNFVFPIPSAIAHSDRSLTIAIRVWNWGWQSTMTGGLQGTMQFGDAGLIHDWQMYQQRNTFWENTQSIIGCVLSLLAAFGAFVLFFMRPSDREYLWFGIFQLFNSIYELLINIYQSLHPSAFRVVLLLMGGIILVLNTALPTFIRHFLKIGRTRLYWVTIVVAICFTLVLVLGSLSAITYLQFITGLAVGLILLGVSDCALLFSGPKDRPSDIRALAVPIALFFCNLSALYIVFALQVRGFTWVAPYLGIFYRAITWPFPLGSGEITNIIVQLTLFSILLLRFVRTRRDEERFKNELEAARSVQSVLVPNEVPSVPGFSIASVYKPAGQVGGDFFQIIPIAGGGALVAIGDVSGKGMPAAMTVSLLVGTLRTLTHYSNSPSEILGAMNRRMLARSKGGFTTCLVLRLDPDGAVTLANAGHLSPYLVGKELDLENGLPLGLDGESRYIESTHSLAVDSQLTLITDGVVEARSHAGELFGFQRAAAIAGDSAESIARAAQEFGQEDDITVLTITRLTAVQEATIETKSPGPSPSLA
jgi:hypothetical protein